MRLIIYTYIALIVRAALSVSLSLSSFYARRRRRRRSAAAAAAIYTTCVYRAPQITN